MLDGFYGSSDVGPCVIKTYRGTMFFEVDLDVFDRWELLDGRRDLIDTSVAVHSGNGNSVACHVTRPNS